MSLLMDALKKAELAKRQGTTDTDPGADDGHFGGLSLEPIADAEQSPQPAAPGSEPAVIDPRPEPSLSLTSHLEELDAKFLEEVASAARQVPQPKAAPIKVDIEVEPDRHTPAPPTKPPPQEAIAPERPAFRPPASAPREHIQDQTPDDDVKAAAKNLFTAKQPEKPEGRRGFAIAVGVLTFLAVAGIGGYFWWQLQPKSTLLARTSPPPPPTQPKAIPPAAPAPPPSAPGAAPIAPAPSTVSATAVPAGPTPSAAPGRPTGKEPDAEGAPMRPRSVERQKASRPPVTDPIDDDPIRITREPLRVDPAITRGYAALSRGEYNLARVEYERARKNDPRNKDVLHGLAAIALRQAQFDQAELLYRQIVEVDPQDSVAIAALLNQRGNVDPGATESRLKSLASAQPELAAPHFSLGNLYARQNQWNDAQQAYFRAYNADPDNPDILYNLAISLEHLRQNKLAAEYYRQALKAAETRPAGFDRGQVATRIQQLQR